MRGTLIFLMILFLVFQAMAGARKPDLVLVKGGEMMYLDHLVTVEHFKITRYEITNEQYSRFLNAEKIGNDGIFKGRQMINISSEDFCVHMGGSWYPEEQPSRINAHYGNAPTHFSNSVGFRVIFPMNYKRH